MIQYLVLILAIEPFPFPKSVMLPLLSPTSLCKHPTNAQAVVPAPATIELPESTGDIAESNKKVIEISIDNQGRYFVNQRRLKNTDLKTLKKAIAITKGDAKEPKLIISADKMTPHQAVVRAMDAARQLGLVHLTFATKQVK